VELLATRQGWLGLLLNAWKHSMHNPNSPLGGYYSHLYISTPSGMRRILLMSMCAYFYTLTEEIHLAESAYTLFSHFVVLAQGLCTLSPN